ncbi:hypothetical protein [Methylobacterium isbiliense]|uniref:Uracil-DNA glycosylase n=1 Tax=Methylobacterium isbiliense TaxID=315478 RepID=A0ABQ4SGG0_9HYPH|nr:hypothetical protein [Methylobacterium isbiliense]MDN3622560.1 hypothetical protein [Methylobacterium isbiliense]GJE01456.1 hypothetical protein GMJLKIPL_3387 [Methylobacterium isbiliense]
MKLSDALSDFDLADLGHRLQAAALHQDRCRRHAMRLGVPDDCPETRRAVANVDLAADALVGAERLVATVVRFLADERTGRPEPRTEAARATPLAMRRPGSSLGPVVVPMSVEGR